MITGHKELITWSGGEDGERVRELVVWFIRPRHGIVIKLPQSGHKSYFAVSMYLLEKKEAPHLSWLRVPIPDENWSSPDEHLGSRAGSTCRWPQL